MAERDRSGGPRRDGGAPRRDGGRTGGPRAGGSPTGSRSGEGRPSGGRGGTSSGEGRRGGPASGGRGDAPSRGRGFAGGRDERGRDERGRDAGPRGTRGEDRGKDAPRGARGGERRSDDRRSDDRRSDDRRSDDRRSDDRRSDARREAGRPTERGGRDRREGGFSRDRRDDRRSDRERSEDQAKYDGPPIPEDITGNELDRNVLAQLRGLPEKLASRVARHLVAAGRLMDSEPEVAYQHTLAARARAARVAVVREATGEAAYAAGHFAEALSEMRAAKRMNGATYYLPAMADCERALGRPERALTLAKSPSVAKLTVDQQIEMRIVEAGARFDLGEVDSALRTLESAPIRSVSREAWVVRLRYAYADLLLRAGRRDEAIEWFHRTAGTDGAAITDAADRILELEGVTYTQSEDTDGLSEEQ